MIKWLIIISILLAFVLPKMDENKKREPIKTEKVNAKAKEIVTKPHVPIELTNAIEKLKMIDKVKKYKSIEELTSTEDTFQETRMLLHKWSKSDINTKTLKTTLIDMQSKHYSLMRDSR